MYDFLEDFDPAAEQQKNDGIPAGTYTATIERAEIEERDDGRRPTYFMFKVTGPECAGAVVHHRMWPPLTVEEYRAKGEPEPEQKRARSMSFFRSQLADACTAVGFRSAPENVSAFIGKHVTIKVTLKTGDYSGNDVKKILPNPNAQPVKSDVGASVPGGWG